MSESALDPYLYLGANITYFRPAMTAEGEEEDRTERRGLGDYQQVRTGCASFKLAARHLPPTVD